MSEAENLNELPSRRLLPGIYVDLDLDWMEHPFAFSRFRIRSQRQIDIIRSLKPTSVRIDPARSDPEALATALKREAELSSAREASAAAAEAAAEELARQLAEKAAQRERARVINEKRRELSKDYQEKTRQIRSIAADMKLQPANAINNVDELVEELADRFETGDNLLARLVDLSQDEFSDYNHVANVTMLALMLASAEGFSGPRLRYLATGAVLHDIGKVELPGSILHKRAPLSPSERAAFEQHSQLGARLVQRVRRLHPLAISIIEQHHEYLDGSGYPQGLRGDAIATEARIVAIADHYDNLCNPRDGQTPLTPKEALAHLYRDYVERLDRRLVERLIDILGVYPPGTVVLLDNGAVGLVVSPRPGDKLAPDVLVYDPDVPQEDALILPLADYPEPRIERALKRGEYPEEIHSYFGVRERIGYMVDHELEL